MKRIWDFLIELSESVYLAKRAADLSRNGKWKEAQELFQK